MWLTKKDTRKLRIESRLTCLLAGIPTSLWPSSVKATVDGVVLWPILHELTFSTLPKKWNNKWELTLCIFNNLSIVSFHDCDAGISSTQINSNNATKPRKQLNECPCQFTYLEKFLCCWMRDLVFYFFKSVLNILCFLI